MAVVILQVYKANFEEEEIVDAPGNDGNASMPEQVKRTNPWRKVMMMMMNKFKKVKLSCLAPKLKKE